MVKKVKLEGIIIFRDDKDKVEEEWKTFEWEREGWERSEEAWSWALQDWLWEYAEQKLKQRGIDIVEENNETFFDWDGWDIYLKKELDLHITIYDKDGEERNFLFTFKVMEEEIEEEEEEEIKMEEKKIKIIGAERWEIVAGEQISITFELEDKDTSRLGGIEFIITKEGKIKDVKVSIY